MSDTAIRIQAVDRVNDNILVHFLNGPSILYHAKFLFDVRDHDGNVPVTAEKEEESKGQ